VRGYVSREGGDVLDLAHDLFDTLRGTDNLVFANSRTMVEVLADQLRRTCETQRLPNEFWPHHGSLSKELRESVEEALKDRTRPLTAVCTNTLEMGIDIGTVTSIAQVGTPPSIAALRQRLGRSGRRGEPSILRIYVREPEVTEETSPEFTLRSSLVQAVASVRLLLDRWCEPPADEALHLSTLVQQVLSLIAQFHGVKAVEAWRALCESGPFDGVDQVMFAELLRGLGADDVVTQMDDDTLVLGLAGEKVVGHYSFYAAFSTPDEYRLVSDQKTLGTIPVNQAVTAGTQLVFAGRRWVVTGVSEEKKTMYVKPGAGGQPPLFLGDAPPVHGRVRREMRVVYEDAEAPGFLDRGARGLLAEGRAAYAGLGLDGRAVVEHGRSTLLFPWAGDRVMDTMALMLRAAGMDVVGSGVALRVRKVEPASLLDEVRSLAGAAPPDPVALAGEVLNKERERYDRHLPDALLDAGYASQHLDVPGAVEAFRRVTEALV
jgi:ATP-dependent Lhr-like helicase